MSERKDDQTNAASGDTGGKNEIAKIESPPLAPQMEFVKLERPTPLPDNNIIIDAKPNSWPSQLLARAMRLAPLAASMLLAAGIGAAGGAYSYGAFAPPPAKAQIVGSEERKAMQKTIARLNGEVSALKANIETAKRETTTQIAKITDRFERAAPSAGDITASITPPPRPASAPQKTPQIIDGWFVREGGNGMVLVEGGGEIFEVVPGAPLPGLGRVEAITRQNGRWVVVTPKGIITSMRARQPY